MTLALLLAACGSPTDPVQRVAAAPTSLVSVGPASPLATTDVARLEQVRWTRPGDVGWAWVARFPRDARVRVVPSDHVASVDEIHSVERGSALVNGGFYDSGPMGLVRHGGADVAPLHATGGSGVLFWSADQPLTIVHRDDWGGRGFEALQSIDRLVDQGRSLVQATGDARLAARTAVAAGDREVLLVVAASDCSHPGTGNVRELMAAEDCGLPLWAFADLLVAVGAREALNMDGGISVAFRASMGDRIWSVQAGAGTINAVVVGPP